MCSPPPKVPNSRLDAEPAAFPDDLDEGVADEGVADDRVVASALDFRWRRRGVKVAVLAGDLDVLRKARAHDLPFHDLLEHVPPEPEPAEAT